MNRKNSKSFFSRITQRTSNPKILIQGLGLNRGGVGTAEFFLKNGFKVLITDLKTEEQLNSSILILQKYQDSIQYVLGEHRTKDFEEADLVVKGPGVPPENKFLQCTREKGGEITTDIAIFLEIAPCPVYAVTGSKGKSTVVSTIYEIFRTHTDNAFLGGNITISPLTFCDKLDFESKVILELSSWQLRDIRDKNFHFAGAAITNILKDHQNYYHSMEQYVEDKLVITHHQTKGEFLILPETDIFLQPKKVKSQAKKYYYDLQNTESDIYFQNDTAILNNKNKSRIELFKEKNIKIPGLHARQNILVAGAFAYLAGIEPISIRKGIRSFQGVPYRMERIREWQGITFINDTTATIPDAASIAIQSIKGPVFWIAGGNDKNLDFSIIKKSVQIPEGIYLLKGDGTEKLKQYLNTNDYIESDSLEYLFLQAVKDAKTFAKESTILFSPGCTSFGLFENEFARGDAFNHLVKSLEEEKKK
ncbi:MAG: UDP-N-acetylmuramoyl-L-alanine--D-glutamate ligase [Spirochaetes bacterium]|nr:UDP-N-acetylmuramoyl-L-alanine--D-glutamate ligase [Spirochaetota bacterium]